MDSSALDKLLGLLYMEFTTLAKTVAKKQNIIMNADGHLVFPDGTELWVDTTSTTASN